MPITLPTPNNTREAQAAAFIDLMDKRTTLTPGMHPSHIVKAAYETYKETGTTPEILRCAGRLIAQYLPIVGITPQWAFLVMMTCPPTGVMSNNSTFLAFTEYSWLATLHQQLSTNKPPTIEEFRAFAHAVIDPNIKDANIPEPPWTLGMIAPFRHGYTTLVEHYYAP